MQQFSSLEDNTFFNVASDFVWQLAVNNPIVWELNIGPPIWILTFVNLFPDIARDLCLSQLEKDE